jgi:hypothetical protein
MDKAKTLLRWSLGGLVFLFGLDKFFNILSDWPQYIPVVLTPIIPIGEDLLMKIVGVVEMIAGTVALTYPRIGGYILAIGFVGLALVLFIGQGHYNVAVINIVLAINSYVLAKLFKTN